jgi:hypothetical protein
MNPLLYRPAANVVLRLSDAVPDELEAYNVVVEAKFSVIESPLPIGVTEDELVYQ